MKKNLLVFIMLVVSFSFGQDSWFPMRVEYSSCGYDEYGVSSGVWWSWNNNGVPKDAYGPVFGLKGISEKGFFIPGMNFGVEANNVFLCARMLCSFYKTKENNVLTMVNPQVGFTWLTFVNLYFGYNKKLAGTGSLENSEYNITLCMNMPSYLFTSMYRKSSLK